MTSASRYARTERAEDTREAILTAAERLFAERGIAAVSNRHIVEAAEQGNNAAVVYHFGNRADLVLAIEHKHAAHIEELRQKKIADTEGSEDLRDWVGCLVAPYTAHLASLPKPSCYARFIAQVVTDPTFRDAVATSAMESASLRRVVAEINDRLPDLPSRILAERNLMTRMMLHHTCAEYERSFAEGRRTPRRSWSEASDGLIDVIVAVWQAPVTERPRR